MQIITNNVPREVHDNWNEEGEYNDSFVIYKGEKYLLEDFQSTSGTQDSELRKNGWDGYLTDTFFSGILLKWVPDTDWEMVIIGRFYA